MVIHDQSRPAAVPVGWMDPPAGERRLPLWRRALPLLLWLGCLVVAIALLLALGDAALAAPSLTEPGTWRAWAADREPTAVTMAVLRLLALAVAWYLTGVTSISVVARALRAVRLVGLADALSVGPIKAIVQQAVGVGLAAGVLATVVPVSPSERQVAGDDGAADIAVMVPVRDDADVDAERPSQVAAALPVQAEDPGHAAAEPFTRRDEGSQRPVMVPVPAPGPQPDQAATPFAQDTSTRPTDAAQEGDAPWTTGSETPAPDASLPEMVAPETAAPEPTEAATEVRVEPGDHFWAIAERTVAEHLGRPGTEAEVVAQWEATLAANADRLVVAGNPDLLVPGQRVVVPPLGEVAP